MKKKNEKRNYFSFARNLLFLGGISVLCYGLWIEFDGYSSASKAFDYEQTNAMYPVYTDEVQKAFSLSYAFIGSGNQCFVYGSQDGQYVLKLFKQRFHFPHTWIARFPHATKLFPYLIKKQMLAKQKYAKGVSGYTLAGTRLWNESALLYLHLSPTKHLSVKLKVIDRFGIPHELFLDDLPFLIQRKATLAKDYLTTLKYQTREKETQEAMQSLLLLVKAQTERGVHDEDFNPRTNFGFVGNRAIFIDPGRFTLAPPEFDAEKERATLNEKIRLWSTQLD